MKENQQPLADWQLRLKEETEQLADRVRKLNAFMSTKFFYELPRTIKDLRYAQAKAMLDYLQTLGKLCELYEIVLEIE